MSSGVMREIKHRANSDNDKHVDKKVSKHEVKDTEVTKTEVSDKDDTDIKEAPFNTVVNDEPQNMVQRKDIERKTKNERTAKSQLTSKDKHNFYVRYARALKYIRESGLVESDDKAKQYAHDLAELHTKKQKEIFKYLAQRIKEDSTKKA